MKSNQQGSIVEKRFHYHLAALSIVLIISSIVYFDSFRSMVAIWLRSDTFFHGFIILPISVFLVWRRWPYLKLTPPTLFVPGVFFLLLISTSWFVADILGIQVGKQLAATAIIPVTVMTMMGVSFARSIAFPLGYLIFAVPFGVFWIPELMEITADFAIGLLRLTGIPVLRDGLFLSIPSGNFEVAKACSGIRYVLASLALGTLYAYLSYQRTYKRLIFVGFSLVLPIVANGIRAYGIIAIAHYSDMQHAVGIDHLIYGWIFFGVVIGLMFLVGSRYTDSDMSDQEAAGIEVRDTRPTRPLWLGFVGIAAVTAVVFGPSAGEILGNRNAPDTELSTGLPETVSGWRGAALSEAEWAPSFVGTKRETLARYLKSGKQVDVALVRYAGQRQGSELANGSNSVFGNNGWRRRNTRVLTIEFADRTAVQLFETSAIKDGIVRRFWYWYEVDGKSVLGAPKIKLYEAQSLLLGRPPISSAIIVSVIEDGNGQDILRAFVNDAYDAISNCLSAMSPQADCRLGRIYTESN